MRLLTLMSLIIAATSCSRSDEGMFFKKSLKDAQATVQPLPGEVVQDSPDVVNPPAVVNPPTSGNPPAVVTPPPVTAPPVVVAPPSEKDICEPLKEEKGEVALGYGLVGKLYDGAPHKINHFSDLLSKGTVIEGNIYMSKLDIPTRKFEQGFPREDGTLVMNAMGAPLIENFGIEFNGSLELLPGEEPGYYEIGIIADDGVVLEVGAEQTKIINGDHHTPTKFFCGDKLVKMETGKPVPMRLRYFQGPRYHLALIMIWRKVASLSEGSGSCMKSHLKMPVKESRCGIAGNKFFFDPDSESHPQMEYLDLFDPAKRAVPWSVVKHKNLRLPAGYSNKECVSKP